MPDASFYQAGFLGGEWSPFYQGRIDNPKYKMAMNVCLNGIPVEEGAWVRRSGTRLMWTGRYGNDSKLIPFISSDAYPVMLEFSDQHLRAATDTTLVFDSDAYCLSISNQTPAIATFDSGSSAWVTGDVIEFILATGPQNTLGILGNIQVLLTEVGGAGSQVFSLSDPVSGASIDGSQVNFNPSTATVYAARVLDINTVYARNTNSDWYNIRQVQTTVNGVPTMFFFDTTGNTAPYQITQANPTPPFISLTYGALPLQDGPYYAAQVGQTLSPNAQSGTITMTTAGGFGPFSEVTSDAVGTLVRVYSTPPAYDSGHTYAQGDAVYFSGLPYTSLQNSNTANEPDLSPSFWQANPEAAQWIWGTITSVIGPTQFDWVANGSVALPYLDTINTWQVGLLCHQLSLLSPFPRCGCMHENRLWFYAAGFLCASQPGDPYNFSPTLTDGTVTDASAITVQLQTGGNGDTTAFWMESNDTGLLIGTPAGEWIVQASALDDPITPTSFQARRKTKYGVAQTMPVRAPLALIFVQRFARRVLEYLPDVFTGRYVAPNLAATSKHLTKNSIVELAYQETPTPIVWMRDNKYNLIGMTYRRVSSMVTEEPTFAAWHRHTLGNNREVSSLCVLPLTTSGSVDGLFMSTLVNGPARPGFVEKMLPHQDEETTLYNSWFLDSAVCPSAIDDVGTGAKLWGLYNLVGQNVTAWLGGQLAGTGTVGSDGSLTIPYSSTFTSATLPAAAGQSYGDAAVTLLKTVNTTPVRSASPATIGNYSGAGNTSFLLADFANDQFLCVDGTNATVYNLTSRTQLQQSTLTALFGTTTLWGGGGAIGSDGNWYVQYGSFSRPKLAKVSMSSGFSIVSQFGAGDNGSPKGPLGIEFSAGMMTTFAGGNFLVSNGSQTGGMSVVDLDNMRFVPTASSGITSLQLMTRGAVGNQHGSVFLCDWTSAIDAASVAFHSCIITAGAQAWAANTYGAWSSSTTYATGNNVSYNGIAYTSLVNSNHNNQPDSSPTDWATIANPFVAWRNFGTLAAASIDATWTAFTVQNIAYDQTDGCLIAYANTQSAVTNQFYLLKIRTSDASVVWKLALPHDAHAHASFQYSRITGGQMGWTDTNGTFYSINTATGAVSLSFSLPGVTSANGGQLVDVVTGAYILTCNYTNGTGAPTPLSNPNTPSSFSANWAVLIPGTATIQNTSSSTSYSVGGAVGVPFTSQGQILRPLAPQEAGAANGPALGKTRRNHMIALLLNNAGVTDTNGTGSLKIGTDFVTMHSCQFKSSGGTVPLTYTMTFSGVYQDTVEDNNSFNGMLAWQATGPYPAGVVALQGFLHTQDR